MTLEGKIFSYPWRMTGKPEVIHLTVKPAIRKGETELPEKSHFRKVASKLPITSFYVHYKSAVHTSAFHRTDDPNGMGRTR